jgi:hypothetical protein
MLLVILRPGVPLWGLIPEEELINKDNSSGLCAKVIHLIKTKANVILISCVISENAHRDFFNEKSIYDNTYGIEETA